jgi:glycosyltransferase 2 family protein
MEASHQRRIWVGLRRAAGAGITVAIFVWMLRPVVRYWPQVKDRVWETSWSRVLAASVMFAAFLFVFRALSWRRILIGFGHRLPVAPTTRIWSTSELARYLPGVIWQIVGRAYLVRPYGVSGTVCSASQVLELVIFLLANILLAVGCLVWLGHKTFHGLAGNWLLGAVGMIPVLAVLVHPKIFYPLANRVMAKLGKPLIVKQLRFRELCGLLVWALLGLVWQSLAIWLVVQEPLGLQFTKWWVVAGAYSLAWCAGFLAFWAPGGIGVRELVFVTAMEIALPPPVRRSFADPKVLLGFLAFLSVLLRLWATTGELLLAGLAYGFDYRGALGQPDACGVIKGRAGAKECETISRSPPAETPARIISTAQVDAEPRIQESPSTLNIVSDIL